MGSAVYTPNTFRPDDLPREEQQFADGIAYFLHSVMMGRIHDCRFRKGRRNGFVPLKSDYMRSIVGRHNWSLVRRLGMTHRFVECDEAFRPGIHSKGYRVLPPHDAVPWERRELDDASLSRRLNTWRRKRHEAVWEEIRAGKASVPTNVCEFLLDRLQRLQLLDDAPLDRFAPEVGIAADMIRRGDWFFHPDPYGRIHTNLTNLKRELRPFLRADGVVVLQNLDIANSQPLFVGLLAKATRQPEEGGEGEERKEEGSRRRGLYVGQTDIAEVTIPRDVLQYLELCEIGGLYQFVHDRLDNQRSFTETKKRVLATLYDLDSHRNAIYRILGGHFPSLMEFIRQAKRDNHKHFARLAQRTESDFMFGQVVPRLMREQPDMFVGTIHDSVLAPALEAEYVRGVMMSEFGRLGVTPRVRIE